MLDAWEIIANIATFVVWAMWVVFLMWRMTRGDRSIIILPMLIVFAFFALPLVLDVILGQPPCVFVPGMRAARNDPHTSIAYAFYIGIVPFLLWTYGRSRAPNWSDGDVAPLRMSKRLSTVFHWAIFLPVIAVAFAPEPMVYRNYGASMDEAFYASREVVEYNAVVSVACLLSVLSAFASLMSRPRLTPQYVVAILASLTPTIWVQGKRSIVAFVLFTVLYAVWQRRLVPPRLLPYAVGAVLAALGLFSATYQWALRDIAGADRRYDSWRLDYGRDGVTKLTLYRELQPDAGPILEYRGQSIVFDVAVMVPRSMWPDKPRPYAVYQTCAALQISPRDVGWGITTSWLEEAIANCSWFGVIVGPLVIATLCRFAEARLNSATQGLTAFLASLLLVVHFGLLFPIAFIWLAVATWQLIVRRVEVREAAGRGGSPVGRVATLQRPRVGDIETSERLRRRWGRRKSL